MGREGNTVTLTQERFTVHFPNPLAEQWQIPLTYVTELQPVTNGFLLRDKSAHLPNELPPERALKLNVADAGYYRVEYDAASWKMLMSHLAQLSEADRVNLLTDAWALVEANRQPLSHYLGIVNQVLNEDQLAVYDQIIDTFLFINRLLAGDPIRPRFQQYARVLLRPAFDRVGWEAKEGEPFPALLSPRLAHSRARLSRRFRCRGRMPLAFQSVPFRSETISPDLRPDIFAVVGRYADARTWEKLHQLGLKTTSTEEKQNYYEALAGAIDPKLVRRTMPLALTDELPTSRASLLLPFIARQSEHPDLVWEFAREHMKELLAKQDALGSNGFAAGLFTFFSDAKEAQALQAYAKSELPPSAASSVEKAVDEIGFRAEFKPRLIPQLKNWIEKGSR